MAEKGSKVFYVCAIGFFANIIFSFTSTGMATSYILGDLGGSFMTATYPTTFFGIGNATGLPLGRSLGRAFGRKRLTKTCGILFIILTLLLSFTTNYPTFMVIRALQGLVSGPLLYLIPSLLGNLPDEKARKHLIQNFSLVFVFTSIIAVCFGGTIAYLYNWRWIFILEALFSTVAFMFFRHQLSLKTYEINPKPFDLIGYIAFLATIWSLSIFIIMGQQLDWLNSDVLRSMLFIFVIALPFFILRCLHHPNPVINFTIMKSPMVVMGVFQLAALFGMYYGVILLISIWLELDVNYTPVWISILLGSMLLSAVAVMFIVKELNFKFSPITLIAGLLVLLVASYQIMNFSPNVNFSRIVVARLLAGTGFALALPPLIYFVLTPCSKDEGLDGFALFQLTRTICCSLGLSLFSTIWQRRKIFYHSRLGGELTPFSEKVDRFYMQTKNYFFSPEMSKIGLSQALEKQAVTLALNDCFYVMVILLLVLIATAIAFIYWQKSNAAKKLVS